jgi:predicted CopG family antitoxin
MKNARCKPTVDPSKTEPVVKTTISLPPEIYRKGKTAAARDDRSFSNFIARLIEADKKSVEVTPV